jgi:DNA-binding transcriptional LysR family regulator
MSESMLAGDAGEGLVPLPVPNSRLPRTVGALVRRGANLPPLAQRFLEILREAARTP